MNKLTRIVRFTLCASAISLSTSAQATDLVFTADTSSIKGETGTFYLDFISGGNSTSNFATISSFSTDGTLGVITPLGEVSGSLPSTVDFGTDTTLFNEYAQNITFGNQISFHLNLTENAPDPLGTPDSFSAFVAYSGSNFTQTTDPTGSNALFLFNIDGTASGNLNVYTLSNGNSPWQVSNISAVPELSEAWLLMFGLMGLGLKAKRQQRV
ncbi:NF038129 family PEP-CTERM protein [Methylomonas sp. AM2-LC]|uniref:NF038129 family PEP-CTERM protein n=1 Tax=Methylomonas sp. AM2-LC TaxID=3153301 RepID=UPI0032650607